MDSPTLHKCEALFSREIAVVLYVSNKLSELKRQVQHVKGRGLSVLFFCFFHLRPPLPHQILRFDVILTASVGIQLSAFAMSTPYNTAVALGKIELESLKNCRVGFTYSATDYFLLPHYTIHGHPRKKF